MTINMGPLGEQTILSSFILSIGTITAAAVVFNIVRILLSTFILPGVPITKFGPKGSWAVITGASDGIGKEYALQIAKRHHYNLLLVSRTQSKLDDLSSQISSLTSKSPIQTETLAIDFSQNQDLHYTKLAAALKGKQVSVLINNVGQSHSIPVSFSETSTQEMQRIININCTATLRITSTILSNMRGRGQGLILTMGSFGGFLPTPLLATYSGSKAFLQHWSNALAAELAPEGITVYFVHAYLITSAMSKVRRASLLIPSEKTFVRSVLAKITRRGGSVGYAYSGSPYWAHALMLGFIAGVYGPMNSLVLKINRNMHVDIRRRALKKAERDAAKGKKDT